MYIDLKDNLNATDHAKWESSMDTLEKEIRDAMGECVPNLSSIKSTEALTNSSTMLLKQWLKPVDFEVDMDRLRLEYQEGTRLWLLDNIRRWTSSKGSQALWFKGAAGVGKSVMAWLVANELRQTNALGATFFCKHDDGERNDPGQLVNTIAYGLARWSSTFHDYLLHLQRSQETHEIVDKPVSIRFTKLIVEPLNALTLDAQQSVFIVLDALDECAIGNRRHELLNVLRIECKRLPKYVKFFITS
jgi:hypothetical protein